MEIYQSILLAVAALLSIWLFARLIAAHLHSITADVLNADHDTDGHRIVWAMVVILIPLFGWMAWRSEVKKRNKQAVVRQPRPAAPSAPALGGKSRAELDAAWRKAQGHE